MFLKQLTKEQFEEYQRLGPMEADSRVRKWANVPEDRYYSVSVWPEHLAGRVFQTNLFRKVTAKKISKSDQQ
jgi:hypothetical protein